MSVDLTIQSYVYFMVAGYEAEVGITIDDAELGMTRNILNTAYSGSDPYPESLDPVLDNSYNSNWSYPRTKGNFHFPAAASNTHNLIALAFSNTDSTYGLPVNLVAAGFNVYGNDTPVRQGIIQDGVDVLCEKEDPYSQQTITETISVFELINARNAIDSFNGHETPTYYMGAAINWLFVDTNIPIFETVAQAEAYIQSGGTVTIGLLNGDGVIPEYDGYTYFVKNQIYKDGSLLHYYDYKIETNSPTDSHKVYFMVSNNTIGYDLVLHGSTGSTVKKILNRNRNDAANEYAETSSIPTDFLRHDQRTASGHTYTSSFFRTNIYIFDNQQAADDYEQYGDASGAVNVDDVNRANDTIVDGHIGEVVSQTDNGSSGIQFTYGGQLYAMSNLELANFFHNVLFNNDPVQGDRSIMEKILDGTQLWGANQIAAINGIMYLPISDITDICTVSPNANTCTIGTYVATISADKILKNDKMIDCGSADFNETYGDIRDYEPYCKLGVWLPFIGYKELSISRYINKTVSLKYAVDVVSMSGACTAFLYADGVLMDSFDGCMGVQRPVSSIDVQTQTSQIVNGVLSTSTQAAKTIGTAGMAAIGAAGMSETSSLEQAANFAGTQGGMAGTILNGYNTLQAAIDPPMSTRGAYSGALGQFSNMYPYFVFAWLKTSKPANEIETVGLPSNAGGSVGSFGGYLKCASFNLANGFGGTQAEAAEIVSQMLEGVYVS